MKLELTKEEASFLTAQLSRHLEHVQGELAHTEKRELQHELAQDLSKLQALVERLKRGADGEARADFV
jgi:hypothetical protein